MVDISLPSLFRRLVLSVSVFFSLLCLTGCETNKVIINDVDEREANEIVVLLASKGINSDKTASGTAAPGAGGEGGVKWNISVSEEKATEAMAYLNQNGLPRIKGISLLDLFAKAGLMSSEK